LHPAESVSTRLFSSQFYYMQQLETWTLLATDIKALEAFHVKCQRQLLQISWQQFIRNDEVAATTGLPSISEVISHRRSTLFGHIARPTRCPGAQGPPLPSRPVSWTTTQRPVETLPGPTPRDMDRPGQEGQRNPPGGPVEASDKSWSPRSNATAPAGYVITTTTRVIKFSTLSAVVVKKLTFKTL